MQTLGQFDGLLQSFVATPTGISHQSVELFGVWRQDDVLGQLLHPCAVRAQHVQGIGIDNHGTLRTAHLSNHSDGRSLILSQPWTDAQCVKVVGINRLAEHIFVGISAHYRFRNADLQDVVVALGRAYRYLSHADSQRCPRCQYGCAGHAIAAGHQERVPHVAFVRRAGPMEQFLPHVLLFQDGVSCVRLVDELLGQPDVQHLHAAEEALHVWQHHGQFLLL